MGCLEAKTLPCPLPAEWGHSFRPAYFRLGAALASRVQAQRILALTATATRTTEAAILQVRAHVWASRCRTGWHCTGGCAGCSTWHCPPPTHRCRCCASLRRACCVTPPCGRTCACKCCALREVSGARGGGGQQRVLAAVPGLSLTIPALLRGTAGGFSQASRDRICNLFTGGGPLAAARSAIIYCAFKEDANQLARMLGPRGVTARAYHAGKDYRVGGRRWQ